VGCWSWRVAEGLTQQGAEYGRETEENNCRWVG
jgi:hypothetical protein